MPAPSPRRRHWDEVHTRRGEGEMSWFQPSPETSLQLIDELRASPADALIDVGGGASRLVDRLLERGFTDVTVLDVSPRALELSRRRLGEQAARVHWVSADITEADLAGPYGLWHDRAAFHFLTEAVDRRRYVERIERALRPGGHVIIATFAEDGPARCSGLPVVRYGPDALSAELGPGFELRATRREIHHTPDGREQAFVYCAFRRRGGTASSGGPDAP